MNNDKNQLTDEAIQNAVAEVIGSLDLVPRQEFLRIISESNDAIREKFLDIEQLEEDVESIFSDAWRDYDEDGPEEVPPRLSEFEFYLVYGTRFNVTLNKAMYGYDATTHDNWSLEFAVTNSRLDDYAESGTPATMSNPEGTDSLDDGLGTSGTELHDADASADPAEAQSYYRLPIIRDGKWVSFGGVYRENLIVDGSKGPVVELVRIG